MSVIVRYPFSSATESLIARWPDQRWPNSRGVAKPLFDAEFTFVASTLSTMGDCRGGLLVADDGGESDVGIMANNPATSNG